MDIATIAKQPIIIERVHQSCYRSDAILKYAVELLEAGAPGSVVVRIVRELEDGVATRVATAAHAVAFAAALPDARGGEAVMFAASDFVQLGRWVASGISRRADEGYWEWVRRTTVA